MTPFRLNYLFYVGIILPTVVTLALFVFFVICWRKQSARKAVLTKLYDPHGTMRKLGISNKPPPPPVFIHRGMASPTSEPGGEDNAAYDMSRSPSAENNGGGNTRTMPARPSHFHVASPSRDLDTTLRQLTSSPSRELELAGRLAFHSRLDSGLSESACESPGAASHGGGAVGGGGGGGVASRDRPQSQASHSSHSTDSEDSGFRSSRSTHLTQHVHHEPPVLKRSRSAGRGKGRGYYHRAATSSPDSDTEPSLPLTPTTLWSHQSNHHHYQHCPNQHPGEDTIVKNSASNVDDIDTHLGWKYLQELSSPGHKAKEKSGGVNSSGNMQTLTCHQSMTLAQVHTSHDMDNPEVFGFSVV